MCGLLRKDPHKGGGPRQPDLGTRIGQYRCFLPDLAGFSTYRREGTNGGHHIKSPHMDVRALGRMDVQEYGGESGIRTREAVLSRLHTFQACSFNHSDISPGASWIAHSGAN